MQLPFLNKVVCCGSAKLYTAAQVQAMLAAARKPLLGTQAENMKDMHSKGRFKGGAKAGNQNAVGNIGWRKGGITAKYVKDKSCE